MIENFPKLMSNTKLHFQKANGTPARTIPKHYTKAYEFKTTKQTKKQRQRKILKEAERKKLTYRGKNINYLQLLRGHVSKKRVE